MKINSNFIEFDLKGDIHYQLLIDELLDNGQAEKIDEKIRIHHEQICKLSSIDQSILRLPDPYPFEIKLSQKGLFCNQDFKIGLGFYEYNHGNQVFGERVGSILSTNNKVDYLLSLEQYLLCESVEEFNNLESRDFVSNLIRFSDIKKLSRKSAAILDSMLINEEVIVPEGISINIDVNGENNISLRPKIENLSENEDKQLVSSFSNFKRVRSNYNIKDSDGNKLRIPITDKQRSELKKIKEFEKKEQKEKKQIIENPATYFDPEIIDLSNFSDRVIEIGLFKPRYFPFISPFKSEWIPGFIIDDGKTKKKLSLENEAQILEIENQIQEAKKSGNDTVTIKGEKVPIDEAINITSIANKQLNSKKEPISASLKEVLIIEDNLFENNYLEDNKEINPSPEVFIHSYSRPPNLKDNIFIYDHQKAGIAWLETLFSKGYSGGLLADDMGLGKTIQIQSLIDWHNKFKNIKDNPYLVIAPISLLENWRNEFNKFFNLELKCEFIYGSNSNISIENLSIKKIYLTNYETVRNSKNQIIFGQIDWAIVIVDEAQKIKTPGTLTTNAIKSLKADFKIAATGTPVENSMVDLWSIMDFIVPGLLGSAKYFSKKYQHPINKKISDEELNLLGVQLRSEIGVYFKRRIKDNLPLGLPEKIDLPIEESMPSEQESAYFKELEISKTYNKGKMLKTILNLKKISDHPYLIGYDWRLKNVNELIKSSAKMIITIKLLHEIEKLDEKVIIFSEFHDTQKILQKVIMKEFNLTKVSIINGNTATKKNVYKQNETRQGVIDRFSNQLGFNVIILSPTAAGIGLNVTSANHVIHYTRHWNPAKETQATDRVFRIGQTKKVRVYYPMAILNNLKTFDMLLNQLLKRKRNIADAAMFPSAISEVRMEDFSSELKHNIIHEDYQDKILTLRDFDSFEPYFFESAIALIFKKRGYNIVLTPKSNDKGADIVALSSTDNVLVQVKKSEYKVNDKSVGEILKARGYYNSKYNKKFKLCIATNYYFNTNAQLRAKDNQVEIFERDDLKKSISEYTLNISEVYQIENDRYGSI